MKTIASLLYEIDYNSDKKDILLKLSLLGDKINKIIQKIAKCERLEDAELFIGLLERISSLICDLKFKRQIEIWGSLWEVARRFDRIDAEITQRIVFDEIKEGTFPLVDKNNLL